MSILTQSIFGTLTGMLIGSLIVKYAIYKTDDINKQIKITVVLGILCIIAIGIIGVVIL